jgi:hypothetical protein
LRRLPSEFPFASPANFGKRNGTPKPISKCADGKGIMDLNQGIERGALNTLWESLVKTRHAPNTLFKICLQLSPVVY